MISISKKNIDYTYKVTKVWDTDLTNITLFVSVVPSGDFYIIEHYTLQEHSESTVSDIEAELNTAEGYARILNEAKMQTQGDVETLKTQVVAINNDLILKADTTFVSSQLSTKGNTETIFAENISIPTSSWVAIDSTYLDSADYTIMTTDEQATKCADIALTGITSSHRVKGEPEESQKSNLLGKIASYDGGFRIYAKEVPVDTIYIRSIEATKVVT